MIDLKLYIYLFFWMLYEIKKMFDLKSLMKYAIAGGIAGFAGGFVESFSMSSTAGWGAKFKEPVYDAAKGAIITSVSYLLVVEVLDRYL